MPTNISFGIYPRIIQRDPRFTSIRPGDTFMDDITIHNYETNPDIVFNVMWEFTCGNETKRCMANWCVIAPPKNETYFVPVGDSKAFRLTCKIPETANTEFNCTVINRGVGYSS